MPLQSSNPQPWSSPGAILPLHGHNLQIWRIDLPIASGFLDLCQSTLTAEESARADRRKQTESRQHAILGRGALRLLLAANTDLDPATIPITTTDNGKPQTPGFAFNISHSGNVLLIALQHFGSVGIDVERIDPATPILNVAVHSFTTAEVAALAAISSESACRIAFFQLWARKESLIKADGRGLLLPTRSFEADDIVTTTAATFRIQNIPIDSHHTAALATDQLTLNPQLLHFPIP